VTYDEALEILKRPHPPKDAEPLEWFIDTAEILAAGAVIYRQRVESEASPELLIHWYIELAQWIRRCERWHGLILPGVTSKGDRGTVQ
jgi:hypothetical protein